MLSLHVHSVVRLKAAVPAEGLSRGEEGVVVSVWLSPKGLFYEVEFPKATGSAPTRALLPAVKLELVGS